MNKFMMMLKRLSNNLNNFFMKKHIINGRIKIIFYQSQGNILFKKLKLQKLLKIAFKLIKSYKKEIMILKSKAI